MDTLRCMRSFTRVAEVRSFAAAARQLSISPALVTKHVQTLEKRVGSRLFNRNTRQISLTEVGMLYWQHCRALLADLENVEEEAAALSGSPRGRLRLTAPTECRGIEIETAVTSFMSKYPEISIDLELTTRYVDMIKEEFDLAIRAVGSLPMDGALIARRLTSSRLILCAAPEFLKRCGAFDRPEDLLQQPCLVFTGTPWRNEWPFSRAGTSLKISVRSQLQSNNNLLLVDAAKRGAGIVMQPSFNVWQELQSGELVSILDDWEVSVLGIFSVMPHRKYVPRKVRLFVDFFAERFKGGPMRDHWLDQVRKPETVDKRSA